MVDFHSHILYDVDDGSEDVEMSMRMVEQSIKEGVKILAMTPHHIQGMFEEAMEDREAYMEKFQFLNTKYGKDIEIIPSLEIMVHENLFENIESGYLRGYGDTKTLLVELNLMDLPQYAEGVFYKLKKAGYQVILAHPERNKALRDDPEKMYHLHDLGVLFQLNAGSLLGQFGEKTETFAKNLITSNLIHAIGSDGHKDVKRDMRIKYAYETVKELNEPLYENIMENGPRLIKGEAVTVLPYKPWVHKVKVKKMKKKKKSLLQLLGL